MSFSKTIHLRKAQARDEPFLESLFKLSHTPHLDPQLQELQWQAQKRGYKSQFPEAVDTIIEVNGSPAGRILILNRNDTTQIIDLAIMPGYQGRGLATATIKTLPFEGLFRCKVLASNLPAQRLFQSLGWKVVGRCPPYVHLESSNAQANTSS